MSPCHFSLAYIIHTRQIFNPDALLKDKSRGFRLGTFRIPRAGESKSIETF
jgi:hypothetical protein